MLRIAVILALFVLWLIPALAQSHVHGDQGGLPDFYAKWLIPNPGGNRSSSCCSEKDCYSTAIELRHGAYYARRREDQRWIRVPDSVLEQNQPDPRESPDGSSHVCMQPPGIQDRVYCAVLGSAG